MRTAVAIAVTLLMLCTATFRDGDGDGATAVPAAARAASPKDRRFASAKLGIGLEAPSGWTLSLHTGYPNIIALMLHPNGSRISISVSETTASTARELVDRNRRGLEAQKLAVTRVGATVRDAMVLEARAQGRDDHLRQIYLVRPLSASTRQAVVVTLTARTEVLATAAASLDVMFARMTLETPVAASLDGGAEVPYRDGGSTL